MRKTKKAVKPVKTKRLHLLNLKISNAGHAALRKKAKAVTKGNVSKLLILAAELVTAKQLRSHPSVKTR